MVTCRCSRFPSSRPSPLAASSGVPFQVWIMVVVVIIAAFVLRRTVFGRQVLAVGGNEEAARLSGVPVKRVKLIVYAVSGILQRNCRADRYRHEFRRRCQPDRPGHGARCHCGSGCGWHAVDGRQSHNSGTLLGALIIQLVRYTLLANGVPDAAALVVKAGLIILAVWLQRQEHA